MSMYDDVTYIPPVYEHVGDVKYIPPVYEHVGDVTYIPLCMSM